MNGYLEKIKQNSISGILFLLPVLILLLLVKKVFGYFAKFGEGIAKIIGFDKVLGTHAANFMGALILFLFIYICGYLVRLAFFKRISESIDAKLKDVIPGYEKHKETATKTLIKVPVEETDLPVLIKFGEYWKPGFLVEEDADNAVVSIPKFDGNEVFIVPIQNVQIMKETTLTELKAIIKASGKGLLTCK